MLAAGFPTAFRNHSVFDLWFVNRRGCDDMANCHASALGGGSHSRELCRPVRDGLIGQGAVAPVVDRLPASARSLGDHHFIGHGDRAAANDERARIFKRLRDAVHMGFGGGEHIGKFRQRERDARLALHRVLRFQQVAAKALLDRMNGNATRGLSHRAIKVKYPIQNPALETGITQHGGEKSRARHAPSVTANPNINVVHRFRYPKADLRADNGAIIAPRRHALPIGKWANKCHKPTLHKIKMRHLIIDPVNVRPARKLARFRSQEVDLRVSQYAQKMILGLHGAALANVARGNYAPAERLIFINIPICQHRLAAYHKEAAP